MYTKLSKELHDERTHTTFDSYAFSKQPDYHEPTVRKEFAKAVPLRTVAIYCYDPRAVGIPAAVARALGTAESHDGAEKASAADESRASVGI